MPGSSESWQKLESELIRQRIDAIAADVESAMSDRNLEALNERERACLTHLRQAQELGVSFSRYCRERDLQGSSG